MAKDDDYDDINDGSEIVSSFQSYAAEGDILAKQGNFLKAIEAYSKALTLRPKEKNVLVARSKCYLQLGDTHNALLDADSSLTEEGDFFKGVFQKAEALYSQGDFELALVYYHRGNKFRPELDEFRLGIQKASEAIDNSIGNPKDYKFQPPPGARLVISTTNTTTHGGAGHAPFITGVWKVTSNEKQKDIKVKTGKSAKQLLGELYADREYLEDFVNDKDFSNNPNTQVKVLVDDALKYLDTRTEFWRQQRPIYARKKTAVKLVKPILSSKAPQEEKHSVAAAAENEKGVVSGSPKKKSHMERATSAYRSAATKDSKHASRVTVPLKAPLTSQEIVDAGLSAINSSISQNDYTTALRKTKALLFKLPELGDLIDSGRLQVELYDILAGIHIKLGSLSEGVAAYKKELEVATSMNHTDCIYRSQLELGKLYTRLQKDQRAITCFEAALKCQSDPTEEVCFILFELAKAHHNVKNYSKAVLHGQKAVEISDGLFNPRMGVNSRVVLAQANVATHAYEKAIHNLNGAVTLAKELGDKAATLSIGRRLEDCKLLKEEHSRPIST